MIIDSTSPHHRKTFRVISQNSGCVNLSDLYLQTSKKKDQRAKNILFVSQCNRILLLNPNEDCHCRGMKQLASATCLRAIQAANSHRVSQSSPLCVEAAAFKQMLDQLQPNQPRV